MDVLGGRLDGGRCSYNFKAGAFVGKSSCRSKVRNLLLISVIRLYDVRGKRSEDQNETMHSKLNTLM